MSTRNATITNKEIAGTAFPKITDPKKSYYIVGITTLANYLFSETYPVLAPVIGSIISTFPEIIYYNTTTDHGDTFQFVEQWIPIASGALAGLSIGRRIFPNILILRSFISGITAWLGQWYIYEKGSTLPEKNEWSRPAFWQFTILALLLWYIL